MRFLSTKVFVSSNCQHLLALFESVYGRFIVNSAEIPHRHYQLIRHGPSAVLHKPDGTQYSIPSWPDTLDDIAELILFETVQQIATHLLFHAAVVERDGTAIALIGDSMQGKTTLALALMQRGAGFLSDESAAIQVGNNTVDAMARALSLRPKTRSLLKLAGESRFQDVEGLFPTQHRQQATLRHVFVLGTHANPPNDSLFVRWQGVSAELETAICNLASIQTATFRHLNGQTACTVHHTDSRITFTAIKQLCQQHGYLLLNARTHADTAPDFDRNPMITRISRPQAALAMLPHLQGGFDSALIQDRFAGDETALFGSLLRSLRDVACYALQPGHLDQTADLVWQTTANINDRAAQSTL